MAAESISRRSPYEIRRSFVRQTWRDVVFLHWPVAPEAVAPLLPRGTEPDLLEGTTWIGVVGLRMTGLRFAGLPYPPFIELNVRLYSVDGAGRRAVVFRAMEAGDPLFAALSRSSLRLPYTWSEMNFTGAGAGTVGYRTRRRSPNPSGVGVRFEIRPRGPLRPTGLESALTARWALHQRWWYGRTLLLPVVHGPWQLFDADLLTWEDSGLLAACGLPAQSAPPASVLYARATTARFGMGRTA
jgi:uncharacterized protein